MTLVETISLQCELRVTETKVDVKIKITRNNSCESRERRLGHDYCKFMRISNVILSVIAAPSHGVQPISISRAT